MVEVAEVFAFTANALMAEDTGSAGLPFSFSIAFLDGIKVEAACAAGGTVGLFTCAGVAGTRGTAWLVNPLGAGGVAAPFPSDLCAAIVFAGLANGLDASAIAGITDGVRGA